MPERKTYKTHYGTSEYIAFYEVASTLEMLDRRIDEVIHSTRLFSSVSSRKDLLLNLNANKNRILTEGIMGGGIVEVTTKEIKTRKAA
ncbi:MAG: hypothetical protein J6U54_04000 [Clostridiales bacterium]|nr:hypothetical protein [Clostridiales bacterium]